MSSSTGIDGAILILALGVIAILLYYGTCHGGGLWKVQQLRITSNENQLILGCNTGVITNTTGQLTTYTLPDPAVSACNFILSEATGPQNIHSGLDITGNIILDNSTSRSLQLGSTPSNTSADLNINGSSSLGTAGGNVNVNAGNSQTASGGNITLNPGTGATPGSVIVNGTVAQIAGDIAFTPNASHAIRFASSGAVTESLSVQGLNTTGTAAGGNVAVVAGSNSDSGPAGSLTLSGGNAPSGGGGNVIITGGDATTSGTQGSVSIDAGTGGGTGTGSITIGTNSSAALPIILGAPLSTIFINGSQLPLIINNATSMDNFINAFEMRMSGSAVGFFQYNNAAGGNFGITVRNGNGDIILRQKTAAVTEKSLLSALNTLDDGSGNMLVASTVDATSTTTGSFQTAGGAGIAKTLFVGTGISLPTVGGTASVLNYYEENSLTTTFAFVPAGTSSCGAATITIKRTGKDVSLQTGTNLLNADGVSNNGHIDNSASTLLQTQFRPAYTVSGMVAVKSGGSTQTVPGAIKIDTSGVISFYSDLTQSNTWVNSAVGTGNGVPGGWTFKYQVA